jgi:hypothetical protein
MKEEIRKEIEDLRYDRRAERRVGLPAGIFVLDGRYHVANHGTGAALELLDLGAVLVADLLFDPAGAERLTAGGASRPVPVHYSDPAPVGHRGLILPRAASRN